MANTKHANQVTAQVVHRNLVVRMLPLLGAPLALIPLEPISANRVGDYGLLPLLPAQWYCGLLLLTIGAAVACVAGRFTSWLAGSYAVCITSVIYATAPLTSGMPQYPWVYKHVGVAQYIQEHGHLDWSLDIYQRWPGFFAFGAVVTAVAGKAALWTVVAWAETFFALLNLLLVKNLVGAIQRSSRVAWGSAVLFSITNWLGQEYFAPQAFAFSLCLLGYLVLLRRTSPVLESRLGKRILSILPGSRNAGSENEIGSGRQVRLRPRDLVVFFVIYALIVLSHQITPYFMVLGVGVLVLVGRIRQRWIPLVMLGMTLAWFTVNADFLESRFKILSGLNPFSNARYAGTYGKDVVLGLQVVRYCQWTLCLILVGLAIIGFIRLLRAGEMVTAVTLGVLAISPLPILLCQNYGGEAGLRVLLFWLPWGIPLAFSALTPRRSGDYGRSWQILAAPMAFVVIGALFVPAYLGHSQLNWVTDGEVEASVWFYSHAKPGSRLIAAGPGFPVRASGRYDLYVDGRVAGDPNLLSNEVFRHRALGSSEDVALVGSLVMSYTSSGYLVFSSTPERYAHTYKLAPDGALESLEKAVAKSMIFALAYQNEDARIYRIALP